jgi:hypothetical protein
MMRTKMMKKAKKELDSQYRMLMQNKGYTKMNISNTEPHNRFDMTGKRVETVWMKSMRYQTIHLADLLASVL